MSNGRNVSDYEAWGVNRFAEFLFFLLQDVSDQLPFPFGRVNRSDRLFALASIQIRLPFLSAHRSGVFTVLFASLRYESHLVAIRRKCPDDIEEIVIANRRCWIDCKPRQLP